LLAIQEMLRDPFSWLRRPYNGAASKRFFITDLKDQCSPSGQTP